MIKIEDKHQCCGCEACVQVCPKQCVRMEADEEGFLYPKVDASVCIDCGLCERVCPVSTPYDKRGPLEVYASRNPDDEVRLASSSGGVFTMLAEAVIADGGVVFGVRFAEDWSVEHGYAETKEALAAFRGSKYVQSRVRTAYADVLRFLKAGRKVLFSGTSCQIAGLYRFLRKDYENLLTVEVVCHGVPSPMLWQSYLAYLKKNAQHAFDTKSLAPSEVFEPQIVDINFRNKKVGWQRYGFSLRMQSVSSVERKISSRSVADNVKSQGNVSLFEESSKNLYMRLFLSDMCLRPSCYACKAKAGASHADIALADFWNINKRYADWNDDRGASLVLVYTARGVEAFRRVKSNCLPTDYEFARSCNRAVEVCAAETKYVGKFWKEFQRNGWKNISSLIERSVPLKLRFDLWKMRMKQRLPLSFRQKLGLK